VREEGQGSGLEGQEPKDGRHDRAHDRGPDRGAEGGRNLGGRRARRTRLHAAAAAAVALIVLVLAVASLATAGEDGPFNLGILSGLWGAAEDGETGEGGTGGLDAAAVTLLEELQRLTSGLEPIFERFDRVSHEDLAAAEAEGQPRLRETLEIAETIRENDPLIDALCQEALAVAAETSRTVDAYRLGGRGLGASSRQALERMIYSIRICRWALYQTGDDVAVEVEEMRGARRAHDWARVLRQLETIEAIQRVRIEELQNLVRLFEQVQSVLR